MKLGRIVVKTLKNNFVKLLLGFDLRKLVENYFLQIFVKLQSDFTSMVFYKKGIWKGKSCKINLKSSIPTENWLSFNLVKKIFYFITRFSRKIRYSSNFFPKKYRFVRNIFNMGSQKVLLVTNNYRFLNNSFCSW